MDDEQHIDPEKIGMVQNYMYHEFPHCIVYTFAEGQEEAQPYVMKVDGVMELYRLSVTYEFLRDTSNIFLELRQYRYSLRIDAL